MEKKNTNNNNVCNIVYNVVTDMGKNTHNKCNQRATPLKQINHEWRKGKKEGENEEK
jgi:hypothetical protein